MGLVHVLGVLQDAHGVHKPVGALLGDDVGQVLIVLQHGQVVAGVVGGDGHVVALHQVEDLVHALALVHAPVPGVGHQGGGLADLILIGGVHRVAQVHQGHAEGVPGVVDEQHVAGVLIGEHGLPAGDGRVHHGGVVDDTQGAPGVGDGVQVLRVIAQILEPVGDLLEVGNLGIVQGLEPVLLDELGDHVVRGDDDVRGDGALLEQGVELLVAGHGAVVDRDAGLVLELLDEGLVNVLAPAVHGDLPAAIGGGGVLPGGSVRAGDEPVVPTIGVHLFYGAGGQEQAGGQSAGQSQSYDFLQQIIPPKNIIVMVIFRQYGRKNKSG